MSDLIPRLVEILGEKNVLIGSQIAQRPCSYWDTSPLCAKALVKPRSTEQVCQVLALCHELGQTVVTHGGLTGTVQGAQSSAQDVVLSLECMNAIETIDNTDRYATVQAGCILQVFQEAVAEAGMLFPLDLGARGSCTLGGNISTNAGGVNVLRYGMMRDLVLGLEVVLADGTVLSSMNRMLKNNAGYDLKQLFIGTEGTLGVVTRANVKLKEKPRSANTAFVALDSFDQVTHMLKLLDQSFGGQLSSFEVMWGGYYRWVTRSGWHNAPLPRDYPFYLVFEVQGASAERDDALFAQVMESAMEEGYFQDAVIPQNRTERDRLWAIREDFEAIFEHQPVFVYDVSLPISAMADYVAGIEAEMKRRWPESFFTAFGHLGDGNLHFFASPKAQAPDLHEQVNQIVYEPLKALGGSISAEHGIGLEKKPYLKFSRSDAEIEMMKRLKAALDPNWLLNPSKVFNR